MKTIACFVTSHGLGHATRMVAIINEIQTIHPNIRFIIINNLPKWFWDQNLKKTVSFQQKDYVVDVGLIQFDPFNHDLDTTLEKLNLLLNQKENFLKLQNLIKSEGVEHIICDISPIGIRVGEALKITTTLVENFTWDWIYEKYVESHDEFSTYVAELRSTYKNTTLRIQAYPFCKHEENAIQVGPIHRKFNKSVQETKYLLGLESDQQFSTITTGGISANFPFLSQLRRSETNFVICGDFQKIKKQGNLIFLPFHSGIHFPDVIRASQKVIGKVGYGTTMECWAAKTQLYGIYRDDFRETQVLRDFISSENLGREIKNTEFQNGEWIEKFVASPEPVPIKSSFIEGNRKAATAILKTCNFNF